MVSIMSAYYKITFLKLLLETANISRLQVMITNTGVTRSSYRLPHVTYMTLARYVINLVANLGGRGGGGAMGLQPNLSVMFVVPDPS